MRLLHAPAELEADGRPVCAAIGMFDGVHLGHQHIIGETVRAARESGGLAMVVTFDRHPAAVVAPQRAPLLLQPLERRLAAIEALGPDALWLIHFDEAFSHKPGDQFVRELAATCAPLHRVFVGSNFHFGHNRSGNVALLEALGPALGFQVHAATAVQGDGQAISSTRVREAVRSGDFALAGRLMGRPYELTGPVIGGDRLGRQLGFPTANLEVRGLVLPPHGVYATRALCEGRNLPGVTNIGLRPTLTQPQPSLHVETHLLDFHDDLYGKELTLRFAKRLREEQRFPSLEALRAQITWDVESARLTLAS